MELGGVLLGAGMKLEVREGDYLYGNGTVVFTISRIGNVVEDWDGEWVVLEGQEKQLHGPWRPRAINVRVSALSRSLVTVNA